MSSKVNLTVVPSSPAQQAGAKDRPDIAPIRRVEPAEATGQPDLRLVIEEADGGMYVYRLIDRRTGKVVSQTPREEVLKMREQADYSAGDLFRGKI